MKFQKFKLMTILNWIITIVWVLNYVFHVITHPIMWIQVELVTFLLICISILNLYNLYREKHKVGSFIEVLKLVFVVIFTLKTFLLGTFGRSQMYQKVHKSNHIKIFEIHSNSFFESNEIKVDILYGQFPVYSFVEGYYVDMYKTDEVFGIIESKDTIFIRCGLELHSVSK